MKFSQIAEGQPFEYQGVVYTRKGPLTGVDEQGKSKMIPRSAEVKPLGKQLETPEPDLQQSITLEKALQVHASFEKEFISCIENSSQDNSATLDAIRKCLAHANKVFKTDIQTD